MTAAGRLRPVNRIRATIPLAWTHNRHCEIRASNKYSICGAKIGDSMTNWTVSDIPDLSGKKAIVTGGNVGLGFKSVLELARHGASVVIACRSLDKGNDAIKRIQGEVPGTNLSSLRLDLTDQKSIAEFAADYQEEHSHLDILLNNAGVVNLESLQHTVDGHEMHMATNHYGHFALTVNLFGCLCKTTAARVVTVTSEAAKFWTDSIR